MFERPMDDGNAGVLGIASLILSVTFPPAAIVVGTVVLLRSRHASARVSAGIGVAMGTLGTFALVFAVSIVIDAMRTSY